MIELNPKKIRYLIIHHTATLRDKTTFWAVRKYHILKGWETIGYHWFITPQKIYRGRNEKYVGAHCSYGTYNKKSLGICLTGNFETEKPTTTQIEFLKKIVDGLCAKYKIPRKNILGHRETGAKTLCPGRHLLPYIIKLRGEKKPPLKKKISLLEQIAKKIKLLTETIRRLKKLLKSPQRVFHRFTS